MVKKLIMKLIMRNFSLIVIKTIFSSRITNLLLENILDYMSYSRLVVEPKDKDFLKKMKIEDCIVISVGDFENGVMGFYCKFVNDVLVRKEIKIVDTSEWEIVNKMKSNGCFEYLNKYHSNQNSFFHHWRTIQMEKGSYLNQISPGHDEFVKNYIKNGDETLK